MLVWWGEDTVDGLVAEEYEIFGQRLATTGEEVGADDFRISLAGAEDDRHFGALAPSAVYAAWGRA